jgi:predicted metal-dependent enzyme (double-stranded beta helix superfamily)
MTFDLEGFVDACRCADSATAVTALVQRAVERRSELLDAIGPIREQVTRTLYDTPERTVQILGWAPGMRSPAHEHRMWSVIGVCAGREDNGFWKRRASGIERTGGRSLDAGDVLSMGDDAIHDVSNPVDAFTIAIHVYGGDILRRPRSVWHPFTQVEMPFDQPRVDRMLAKFNDRQRREPVPFSAANVERLMAAIMMEELAPQAGA